MAGGRQLVVDVVGDASGFSKATKEATKSAETLGSKLKGVGSGIVLGAGIGAFNLLNDVVSTGIGKLGEAAQAFRDDQVSATQLAGALERNIPAWAGNTAAVEAYASAQGKLGFSDDEVRVSLGQLVGVTHDATEAQELNTLAQDLARAKNIDLATATDIVTKAHEGNGKALKGLGIDIEGAVTGADFLAAAERNVNGAAEEWAATNEGKLAVSNVAVGEAMEKVGEIVDKVASVAVPMLADAFVKVVDVFTDVWTATEPIRTKLAPILTTVFAAIGDVIDDALDSIGAVIDAVGEAMRLVGLLDSAIKKSGAATQSGQSQSLLGTIGDSLTHSSLGQAVGGGLGVLGFIGDRIGGRAAGGPTSAYGSYLVGERGPEILRMGSSGGYVTPNGGGGNVYITVTAHDVSGIMQELKRELTRTGMSLA